MFLQFLAYRYVHPILLSFFQNASKFWDHSLTMSTSSTLFLLRFVRGTYLFVNLKIWTLKDVEDAWQKWMEVKKIQNNVYKFLSYINEVLTSNNGIQIWNHINGLILIEENMRIYMFGSSGMRIRIRIMSFLQGSIIYHPTNPLNRSNSNVINQLYRMPWPLIIRTNCLKAYPINNLEESANYSKIMITYKKCSGKQTPLVWLLSIPSNLKIIYFGLFHIVYPFILWEKVHLLALHCIHIGESVLHHLGVPNHFLFFK